MVCNNILCEEWTDLVNDLLQQASSVGIGIYHVDGNLVWCNPTMCYYLDKDSETGEARNFFVNPLFSSFLSEEEGLIYNGLSTIGNYSDMSYVLHLRVYKKKDSLLVFAEADVKDLFEGNRKMSHLNQTVNNLQRQLIREKKQLQLALEELKETQQLLIHSEKMNALGKLVAGIAHEVNNPIAFVYSNLYSAEQYADDLFNALRKYEESIRQLGSPELNETIASIRTKSDLDYLEEDFPQIISESMMGVERVKGIVEDLRRFSRLDESDLKEVDLVENIRSTISILRSEILKKDIQFSFHAPDEVKMVCYAGQLNQAIMNVLMNAIQAVDHQGEVTLTVAVVDNNLIITIEDNGPGIPDEIKNRIFEPFFTTKPVGSGTGLGLSITYKIIHELHHGNIQVSSIPGKKTVFELKIPTNHGLK